MGRSKFGASCESMEAACCMEWRTHWSASKESQPRGWTHAFCWWYFCLQKKKKHFEFMFLLWQSNQVLASFSFVPLEFRSILRSFSYFLVSTKQLFWAGVCVRPQRLESAADDVLAGSYQRNERARADWLFPLNSLLRRRVISFRACFGNSPRIFSWKCQILFETSIIESFYCYQIVSNFLKHGKSNPKKSEHFCLTILEGP